MTGFRPSSTSPPACGWLLALPQYLIVAIFAEGWEFGRNQAWQITGGADPITVLTLIAAVILTIPPATGSGSSTWS